MDVRFLLGFVRASNILLFPFNTICLCKTVRDDGISYQELVKILWQENGLQRFYAGLTFFIPMQALKWTLKRFIDPPLSKILPSPSLPLMNMLLVYPLITSTRHIQLMGFQKGSNALRKKLKSGGVLSLWDGMLLAQANAVLGSFCWFTCWNFLHQTIPQGNERGVKLLRSGFIGFCSAALQQLFLTIPLRTVTIRKQIGTSSSSYVDAWRKTFRRHGLFRLWYNNHASLIAQALNGAALSITYTYIKMPRRK